MSFYSRIRSAARILLKGNQRISARSPIPAITLEEVAEIKGFFPREKFFIPTSLLEATVDPAAPIAAGMPKRAVVVFDESPVFRLPPDAAARGLRAVAWYDSPAPLRSGWAWGQTYLEHGVAVVEARVGRGTLHLFGPEITFRAQPHGTFKFLFNGILGAGTGS